MYDFEIKRQVPDKAVKFVRELHELCIRHRMCISGLPDGWIRFWHHTSERQEIFMADFRMAAMSSYDSFGLDSYIREQCEYRFHEHKKLG